MKNAHTKTIFYLDLKHVNKYGSAKYQPNPIFSSHQMATESAESVAEEKKQNKKKVGKPIGYPVGGRDAPMTTVCCSCGCYLFSELPSALCISKFLTKVSATRSGKMMLASPYT